ncbi:hypothetical protein [Shewanella acanthi]|uniref:hypothetical protein n=1 Tax=Shewanella acanthi TaxID=2864212 RepID=UPI001C65E840|nr:hypothetical protein [Shewanella acanthi]QYJ79939.1 hypothetical protein K0H61_05865 [Shewanella acanthi]
MISSNQISASNRQKNSGGVYPDADTHAVTFAIFLSKLARVPSTYQSEITLTGLVLWLTGKLGCIERQHDIPLFFRVSGALDCVKNALRTIDDGSESWGELASPYQLAGQTRYLWQPLPAHLNRLLQPSISKLRYNTPALNEEARAILFNLLSQPWKTPDSLTQHSRERKDAFFDYFNDCALVDNTLTATVRMQLILDKSLHHRHASHYQQMDSDQIRYRIFEARNRYLSRIIDAARKINLHKKFDSYSHDFSRNIIFESPKLAKYLSTPGRICQYQMDTSNHQKKLVPCETINIRRKRFLDENEVCQFLLRLDQHVKLLQPKGGLIASNGQQDSSAWLTYYNAATSRIALLFVLLTGARPTHSISIEWRYYSYSDSAFIKDKGKLRCIYLADYLQQEIKNYLTLQFKLIQQLPKVKQGDVIWFYLNELGEHSHLSNRSLRQFMNEVWPGVVPYQLRHFFAQCAITTPSTSRLHDNDIDRLMGHSIVGEHLGADNQFPATTSKLKSYLNSLPVRLGLKEMRYV